MPLNHNAGPLEMTSPGPALYIAFRSMVCGADAQRDAVAGSNGKVGHLVESAMVMSPEDCDLARTWTAVRGAATAAGAEGT